MNDNEAGPVTVIVGRGRRNRDGATEKLNVLLIAPDDDSAVRMTLDALSREGFAEVDLDQIGQLEDMPDEEPHASAYQGALEGEVAIVVLRDAGSGR